MKVLEITKIADQTVKILSDVVGMDDVISLIKMLSITVKEIEADLVTSEANHLKIEAKIQELKLIIKGKDVIIESMAQDKSCENCKHFMSNHSFKLGHSDYLNGCRVLITPSDFLCSDFKSKENQDVK